MPKKKCTKIFTTILTDFGEKNLHPCEQTKRNIEIIVDEYTEEFALDNEYDSVVVISVMKIQSVLKFLSVQQEAGSLDVCFQSAEKEFFKKC